MRSGAWLRIVAIISLILWWAVRGTFAAFFLGGSYVVLWLSFGILSNVHRVFRTPSEQVPRWMSSLRRGMEWASLAAVPGFFLGLASHHVEEMRARAFVDSMESRLWGYHQTNGHFPEKIELMGFNRPRVDFIPIEYSSDGSEFTFRYPNSFSLFGGDWEYQSGLRSWSDS